MPAQRGDDPRKAAGYKPPVGPPGNKVELHPSPGRFHAGVPTPKPQHKAVGQAPRHAIGHEPERHAPIIPRVQHPNVEQVHEALRMAHAHQQQELGSAPTAAKIRAFQRRLPQDYLDTVAHYVRAGSKLTDEAIGVRGGTSAFFRPRQDERTPTSYVQGQVAAAEKNPLIKPWQLNHLRLKLSEVEYAQQKEAEGLNAENRAQHPGLGEALIHPAATLALGAAKINAGIQKALGHGTFGKIVGGVPGDIAQAGTFLPVLAYEAGKATGGLTHGTKEWSNLLKTAKEGVTGGALGHLAKGDIHGALEQVRDHFIISALEVAGAKAAAGRVAGATARALPGEMGSVVHDPRALFNDPELARTLYREREGSKDLGRNLAQRLMQKRHPIIKDEQGNPVQVTVQGKVRNVRAPGTRRKPGKGAEKFQRRRANYEFHAEQTGERRMDQKAIRGARKAQRGIGGKRPVRVEVEPGTAGMHRARAGRSGLMSEKNLHLHGMTMAARGIIATAKTYKADVAREIAKTKDEIARGTGENGLQIDAQKYNLAILEKLKDASPKDIKAMVKAGEKMGVHLNDFDTTSIRAHNIEPTRARRSQLRVAAEAQMGARHHGDAEFEALEAKAANEAERIHVSGRDVAGTHAHLRAKAEYKTAREVHKAAGKRLTSAHKNLAKVKGEIKSAVKDRSRHGLSRNHLAAEDTKLKEAESRLRRAKEDERSARKSAAGASKLIDQNPLPERDIGLRHPTGEKLPTEDIEAHLKSIGRDPNTVAHIPDRVRDAEPGLKAEAGGRRPMATTKRNKGVLYQRGVSDFSPDVAIKEAERKSRMIVRARAWDDFVRQSGLNHPAFYERTPTGKNAAIKQAGGRYTRKEALRRADQINNRTDITEGDKVVVVAATPARASEALTAGMRKQQQIDDTEYGWLQKLVDLPAGGRARNAVLVPKAQLDRFIKLQREPDAHTRAIRELMTPFRIAVLTQPKWLTGNFVGPYLVRLPMYGSGAFIPGLAVDTAAYMKAMSKLKNGTPKQQALYESLHAQYGGLAVGSQMDLGKFAPGPRKGGILGKLHKLGHAPLIGTMGQLALEIPKSFTRLNYVIESSSQRVALGHQLRGRIAELTGVWAKGLVAYDAAMKDVLKELENTPAQEALFNKTNEMLGKYNGFGPTAKGLITTYTPFIPWMLSAFRFVYWTMPAHHTVKFSLFLKAAAPLMAEWEVTHGVGTKEEAPGELQFAAKTGPNTYRPFIRYTEYGATAPLSLFLKQSIAEGKRGPKYTGALGTYPNQILPWLPLEAVEGRTPFGQELKVEPTADNPKGQAGGGDLVKALLLGTASSGFPMGGTIQKLAEGKTRKAYDPFAPVTYPKKKKGKPGQIGGGTKIGSGRIGSGTKIG